MGGLGIPNFVFLFVTFLFLLKTSTNAMKHMILSFKMKGGVISDHFLLLWFHKDSLDTVGFGTYGGGSRFLNQKVTFRVLNVPMGGESPV